MTKLNVCFKRNIITILVMVNLFLFSFILKSSGDTIHSGNDVESNASMSEIDKRYLEILEAIKTFYKLLLQTREPTKSEYYLLFGPYFEFEEELEYEYCKSNGWIPPEENINCIDYLNYITENTENEASLFFREIRKRKNMFLNENNWDDNNMYIQFILNTQQNNIESLQLSISLLLESNNEQYKRILFRLFDQSIFEKKWKGFFIVNISIDGISIVEEILKEHQIENWPGIFVPETQK